MDIHRSRFVPYPTSAISALAFSRSNDSGYVGPLPDLKLAIGRANGEIEIWNPQKGSWVQEVVFSGENKSVDGLAWTQDLSETDSEGHTIAGQQRLFSIASSPAVTEWDLATGQPKRKSTGNFSEVWCLAAQPRSKPQSVSKEEERAPDIVAGCGDGTLVLLSTSDHDLQFKRFLARVGGKRARCMCVTYQSHDRVVAGFADSMIRVFDTRNGSLLRNMSLGVGVPGAPKNAIVWQVRCLPNGDIVSGDSNGEVKFWDGRTYSLSQRITGHETDCLDLITSGDGRAVFSGSIDGKIAVHRLSNQNGRRSWAKSSHRRAHSGEVKAMASFDSKSMSVVVQAGAMSRRWSLLFASTERRMYDHFPAYHMNRRWRVRRKQGCWSAGGRRPYVFGALLRRWTLNGAPGQQQPRKLVARMNLTTPDHIRSVSITSDGRLLAASTSTEVKVFQLRKRPQSDTLAIRKLEVPHDLAKEGARRVVFSPDGKWLATVTLDSEVHALRLVTEPARPKRLQILPKTVELERRHHKRSQTGFRDYGQAISRVAFAPESSMLVASDVSGHLDSWVLEGNEDLTAPAVDVIKHDQKDDSSDAGSDSSSDSDDSDDDDSVVIFYGQHWNENPAGHLLPNLDSPPLIMTFRPNRSSPKGQKLVNGNPGVHPTRHNPHARSHELPRGQHRLWIMTSRHQMFEFDVLTGKLSDWSRRNPTAVLPADFTKIRDRVMGAIWDFGEQRERLWLYGSSFVCMLNVGADLSEDANVQAVKKRGRKQNGRLEKEDVNKRRKLESGAGGKISDSNAMATDEVEKLDDDESMLVDLGDDEESAQGDEDDVDLQLARVRSTEDEHHDAVDSNVDSTRERKWWCTLKYRPILGMVPLGDETRDQPVEVALVERVHWEVRNG